MHHFLLCLNIFLIIFNFVIPYKALARIGWGGQTDITPNQYNSEVVKSLTEEFLAQYYKNDSESYNQCLIALEKLNFYNLNSDKQHMLLTDLIAVCPGIKKATPEIIAKSANIYKIPFTNPMNIEADISPVIYEYNNLKREILKKTLGLEGLSDKSVDSIEDEMLNLFLAEFLSIPITSDELSVLNSETLMDRPFLYGTKFENYVTKYPEVNIKSKISKIK